MTTILKYLKAFLIPLVLAVLFLFVQAFSDLSLPNYMSDIVDIGIQQQGVQDPAPKAISKDGYHLATDFMDDDDKKHVEKEYKLVSKDDKNSDGVLYKEVYKRADSDFYVQKEIDESSSQQLDKIFNQSTIKMMSALQSFLEKQGIERDATQTETEDFDITELYEMKESLLNEVGSAQYKEKLEQNKVLGNQMGIMLTKSYYEELGLDIFDTQKSYILKTGGVMLLIALLGGAATILVSFFSSRIAAGISMKLRRDVFRKIESFSLSEVDKFSSASLITRSTNDITQIQNFFMMGIRMVIFAPIMGVGGIIMALRKSPSMSWIIALSVLVLLLLIIIIMFIAIPKFKIIQELVDRVNLVAREFLNGIMVIRAFRTGPTETARFEKANRDLTLTNRFISRVMAVMFPAMQLIMNGTSILIIWIGAKQIASLNLQVGDMMAFIQYTMQIITAFLMLSMTFILIPRAIVSANRLKEILDTTPTIQNATTLESFKESTGIVEFKDVSFKYDNAKEDAICDISFTSEPGKTTALIGSTGAGKSTIVNLLVRLYDVSKGQIQIDRQDIRTVSLKSLREKVSIVPQKASLLSGTVASNVRIGDKNLTDEAVKEILKSAQADDFVSKMNGGIEGHVAQNGNNLSGGQKQRLSIARALASDSEILVFDDSFSALDTKTEKRLRHELSVKYNDKTIIVVAQRVSSIMNADQIIVLDQGKVVGKGQHHELLKNCETYYEIASSQLSEEELNGSRS